MEPVDAVAVMTALAEGIEYVHECGRLLVTERRGGEVLYSEMNMKGSGNAEVPTLPIANHDDLSSPNPNPRGG